VVFLPCFIGLFHGQFFRWFLANRKNEFALYILAMSYMPLLQSTGGETYFSLMAYWIQFLLIGLVMTKAEGNTREIVVEK